MADNPHYRFCTPYSHNNLHSREMFQQNFITATPEQQMLYHNIHIPHLHQTLRQYVAHQSPTSRRTHSFSGSAGAGSATSSPLSTISNEESLEYNTSAHTNDAAADRLNFARTVAPTAVTHTKSYYHGSAPIQSPDTPIDLTKPKTANLPPHTNTTSSRLLNLLSRKRGHEQSGPLNLSKKARPGVNLLLTPPETTSPVVDMKDAVDNPVELVQLLYRTEVTEKIKHFLNQMMARVFALDEFRSINEADRIRLVLNCWHRLILWVYAENKFTFQVRSLSHSTDSINSSSGQQPKLPRLNQPTMAFVRSIATFIKKYETLEVTPKEHSLLFAITLFHSTDDDHYSDPNMINFRRKSLMRQLQKTVNQTDGGSSRYTALLLYLPNMYGVNNRMVEELFFTDIAPNGDIKILLRDTIKRFSASL